MSYPKLIHEYLDEGLPSPQEEALFSKLAEDPELRKEFNQQVKIHTITQKDMNSITTPVEATSAIFSGLGFNIPPEALKRDGALLLPKAASRFFRKLLPISLALLALAFLGFAIFSKSFRDDAEKFAGVKGGESKSSMVIKSKTSSSISENITYSKASSSESESNVGTSKLSEGSSKVQIGKNSHSGIGEGKNSRSSASENKYGRYSAGEKATSGISKNSKNSSSSMLTTGEEKNSAESIIEITPSETSFSTDKKSSLKRYDNKLKTFGSAPLNLGTALTFDFVNEIGFVDKSKHTFKISGMPAFNVYPVAGFDKKIADILSFSYLYKVNPRYSVGIEVGKSSFNQKFDSKLNDVDIVQLQNPNLLTYGIINKVIAPGLFTERLKPFAQIFTGAASSVRNFGIVGPLVKPQAGIEYKISSNVGISAAYEGAFLWYSVSPSVYLSINHGLIYGLNISF